MSDKKERILLTQIKQDFTTPVDAISDYINLIIDSSDIYDEEINSAMLPLNPYYPTGIGGMGILKKWGPNQISYSIIVTYNINNNY